MDLIPVHAPSQSAYPVYTLSASCPLCHGALTLRQTRDRQRFYVACSRRPCDYTTAYEPALAQLRYCLARLVADLEFSRMQVRAAAEVV